MLRFYIIGGAIALIAIGCHTKATLPHNSHLALASIWYQGKAEVSTYTLTQNRYQDVHPGKAVMIFVSEPWQPTSNVKSDSGGAGTVTVLKNNQIRRFSTGIYDYSIFTSVFAQPDGYLQKITCSSQDWCGQTYLQVNSDGHLLDAELRSYFESEGDQTLTVDRVLSEDAIYNIIRTNPNSLPCGEIMILPAAHYTILRHKPYQAIAATASIDTSSTVATYTVDMPSISRTLAISYDRSSHNKIVGWQDRYPSAYDQVLRTTTARLDTSVWTAYWSTSKLQDSIARRVLGL